MPRDRPALRWGPILRVMKRLLVGLMVLSVGLVWLASLPAQGLPPNFCQRHPNNPKCASPTPTPTTPTTATTTATTTTTAAPGPCEGVEVPPGGGLKTAMDSNPPGTFCLSAGTYTVPSTITAQSDIVVGAGVDRTFIVGTGALNLFTASSGSVWKFRDLDISGGQGSASCAPNCGRAFVGNGERLTLLRVRCHGNDNQCVGSGAADVRLLSSECDHNGNAEFISVSARSTSCIKRIRGSASAINTEVRDSYIHDNAWSGLWFDYYEGSATIENNRIVDNGKAGIQWEVSGGFNVSDNVVIRGNTIRRNGQTGVSPVFGGVICNTCADALIEDNTFGENTQAVRFLTTTREWGNIHGVIVRDNQLNGDALSCPSGVSCSGNV